MRRPRSQFGRFARSCLAGSKIPAAASEKMCAESLASKGRGPAENQLKNLENNPRNVRGYENMLLKELLNYLKPKNGKKDLKSHCSLSRTCMRCRLYAMCHHLCGWELFSREGHF